MATNCIEGAAAFAELAAEWDELARRGMTNTPFQTLAYQQAWWTYLQPAGATLYTLVTRNDAGQLIGIGCFYLLGDTLHFNGCVEESDYLDLIATNEDAAVVWAEVLEAIAAGAIGPAQALDLCNIPAASPSRAILAELVPQVGFAIHEEQQEVCPIIALPRTFDAYLELLDPKQRREVSRKLRRAEGSEVVNSIIGPDEDIDAAVDDFLDLLQSSTFEKRDWLNEGRRALFHDVARAAQQAGTLQLMFSAVEGDRAAALFNFDYDGRIWVYNSGLDPAKYSALGLGVVLTAAAIEHAIATGRRTFDFLRGNEEYKYRMGAEDTAIYRLALTKL